MSILRRQLGRLGMSVTEHDPDDLAPVKSVDVIVLDANSIPIEGDAASTWKVDTPIIALIGIETPSRLKWLLDLQPASFLVNRCARPGFTPHSWSRSTPRSGGSMTRPTSNGWRPHPLPPRRVRRRASDHAPSRAVRTGCVRADTANRHAASHDDRAIMRRHHRRRRHAETDQPHGVTTAPASPVP